MAHAAPTSRARDPAPMQGRAAGSESRGMAKLTQTGQAIKILAVEDEEPVRRVVTEMLSWLGYDVIAAANGKEALRVLNAEGPVDLLVTDIRMPGGLDGFALAREAKRRQPDLKVLYATDCTSRRLEQGSGETFGEVLRKPFRQPQLDEAVRRALDR
jgi:CheY-like chemotaxis protein